MVSMVRRALSCRLVLALEIAVLAVGSAACGKVGCFEISDIELQNDWSRACPSEDQALQFFSGANCSSEVTSVDSEPERIGQYCCYDITKNDDPYDVICAQPAGGPAVPPPAPVPPSTSTPAPTPEPGSTPAPAPTPEPGSTPGE